MNPKDIFDKDLGSDNNNNRNNDNATNGRAISAPAITGKVALLVQDASEEILRKHHFITIEETDEILHYEDGVYKPGGEIIIAKELEAEYGYDTV